MLVQVSPVFTLAIPSALLRHKFEQPDRILNIGLQLTSFHILIKRAFLAAFQLLPGAILLLSSHVRALLNLKGTILGLKHDLGWVIIIIAAILTSGSAAYNNILYALIEQDGLETVCPEIVRSLRR